MAPQTCRNCGCTEIWHDTGTGVCTQCGNVVEESAIVAEVTFGESSNGAAMAFGKNVPVGGDRSEPRAQMIANGKAKIREVATSMKLGPYIEEMARRHFNMCVAINFIKGRSSIRVAAACLYISCRQQKTSHMLIDFSDKLRINVFELGTTYTKLVRQLHLEKDLPLVDPAHYVGRFAAMLEFGSETQKVATDATRLVKRFDSDWLRVGRRPSGICGACLLLAARMNNFRRSIEEIVQVVKISDSTIRKRLEEFKDTPSGNLTVQDFRSLWLEEYVDPPAFTRGKEKRLREEDETEAREGVEHQDDEDDDDADDEEDPRPRKKGRRGSAGPIVESLYALAEDRLAVNGGERSGLSTPTPSTHEVTDPGAVDLSSGIPLSLDAVDSQHQIAESGAFEGDADYAMIAEEVETHLKAGQDIANEYAREVENGEIQSALGSSDEPDRAGDKVSQSGNEISGDQRPADIPATEDRAGDVDNFEDIDDDEVSKYICTSEEVTRKTRLWVEFNLQYLENLAAKGLDEQSGVEPKKKRSKPAKPKDSSNPAGTTPIEATRALMGKKRTISKRINYDRVSALLSTKIPKKKKTKEGRPSRQKTSSRLVPDDGDDGLFGSDGDKFRGLERISDHGSDYSNGRGSAPADDYGVDDGYESDSYQQEA